MTVLIQEMATGHFLSASGEWSSSKAAAKKFCDSRTAIEFCLGRTMPDVRLLVSFENPEHDFYLYPFGPSELTAETRGLLARNAELQQQQWALTTQVASTVAVSKRRRSERQKQLANASQPQECQSAA